MKAYERVSPLPNHRSTIRTEVYVVLLALIDPPVDRRTIFNLCTGQKQLEQEIYERYEKLWAKYFDDVVVPALTGLSSQEMLLALNTRYRAHMKMTKYWSGIFFKYLDKYYTPKKNCPSTKLVGERMRHGGSTGLHVYFH